MQSLPVDRNGTPARGAWLWRLAPCLLLGAALVSGPSWAEEPLPATPAPAAVADTLARSTALRANLGAPAADWGFEGELFFQGYRVGSLSITAAPGTFQGKPGWQVLERTIREAGKARVVSELVVQLAPDLSLLRGELLQRAPDGGSVAAFGWREGVLEVVDQPDSGAPRSATPAIAPSATLGLFALARFAAALPAAPGSDWRLPVFDPRFVFGDDAGKPVPTDLGDLALTVEGLSRTGTGGPEKPGCPSVPGGTRAPGSPSLMVRAEAASGRALRLHLDPASRELREVDGLLPHVQIRRAGSVRPAEPPPWFDRVGQTPLGALDVFVSFGRGYHLPKRELLEAAFHWPSMRAAEIAAGSYPPDVTLEKVRDDWIAEFEQRSKHRTEADCDDLLMQLLTTAAITPQADGTVTITALPVFGGHTFTCAALDGRWWITKLD